MDTKVRDYNRFESFAQDLWAEGDVDEKKRILNYMIDHFEFKKKVDLFKKAVAETTNARRLDKLAADLVLIQSGDRVIK